MPHIQAYGDEPAMNPTEAALLDFNLHVERYMELRDDVADDVPDLEPTNDPARVRTRNRMLRDRLVQLRAGATHGDVFASNVRPVFRRLLGRYASGERGDRIQSILEEDAPAPGAVPIEVNAAYPAGLPIPTTPPPLLRALPPLPGELEYRIIGKDLILFDEPANLIVDFIKNAVP
jgi:hypothetical protein